MKDASHLGIYQGDEVLSINDSVVQDLRQAKELLDHSGQELLGPFKQPLSVANS